MAKFNKDRFFNNITDKVQSAINAHLLKDADYDSGDLQTLHAFIQYQLVDYIEDRKFAIDVLDDFSYDDEQTWDELEQVYGEFRSLMDIALVNLWLFLESQGATEWSYYQKSNTPDDTPVLNIAHTDDKFNRTEIGADQGNRRVGAKNAPAGGKLIDHGQSEEVEDEPAKRLRFSGGDEENEL